MVLGCDACVPLGGCTPSEFTPSVFTRNELTRFSITF
jgi:hypothetical protein